MNSYEFSQRIQNIWIVGSELLVSFDVQYMYTNISGEKAISALLEISEREEGILEAEPILKESLTLLINLTVRTTYFTFNGSIHEQIFGLPMGSPLPPLLPNVFMDKLGEFNIEPNQSKQYHNICGLEHKILGHSKS
ncbi:unnamed protein product [Protopolystoma xenopodis]|uniref:Reverse transcriptase domain-containing protein n=1 Tax=Protopolystoma xenopodis TaxID=117903 RepID=A0A448XF38_9PLAT|nr:unnamed protein product [Protopolystoma xenopodis]